MPRYALSINGVSRQLEADADMPVLWALRDLLGLTGTKYGCGTGICGSCTIHLDGQAVRACTLTLADVGTRQITTIESFHGIAHPLIEAWLAERVSQCGYCQPGQIMAAAALLSARPHPSDAEIDAAMSSVLCRCGTYQRIRRAIHRAAGETSPQHRSGPDGGATA